MANALLTIPDWSDAVDAADITATQESSNFPVENLLKLHPTDRYENTSPTTFQIDLDRGSSEDMLTFALLYTNASASATWRITAADVQGELGAGASFVEILDTTSMRRSITDYTDAPDNNIHAFYVHDTTVNRQWVRFDIAETVNSTFRAGRVMVGSQDPLATLNIGYGSDLGAFEDRSRRGTTARGRMTVAPGYIAKRFAFQGFFLTHADMTTLMKMYEARGANKDWLFVRDRTETKRMQEFIVPGYLPNRFQIVHTSFGLFNMKSEIVER
jgi:hypothetical protein